MGTRKISQLETISDANLSGEAILPVVVSDPLIPNRKAKVNQLFRGVSQGSKSDPGLCFDLDRNTGLYQDQYDEFGISFGSGGIYMSRIDNGNSNVSLYMTAVDSVANNADIVLSPKGTGAVKVTGNFVVSDQTFILEDAQGPKARFEVSNVGTGTNTRIFTLPAIVSGNGTVLVGDDTQQTLRNKTLLIDEDNFVIVDGDDEAIFQLSYADSIGTRRSFFLPDAGTTITDVEPSAVSSTLVDTKAEQIIVNKTLVNPKVSSGSGDTDFYVAFNAQDITANRSVTLPDANITLVGTSTPQDIREKRYINPIFADEIDNTKRVTLTLANLDENSNSLYEFPETGSLNNAGNNNVFVTERAQQNLFNKTMYGAQFASTNLDIQGTVQISIDNITAPRTIRFPDADATLLSTENVTVEDVTFGAGIGAATLSGRTRQQQFFYAGF